MLVSALTSGQIDVLSLKGPVLAQRLYGGLERRPFGDLDLLIRPEQAGQACSILSDNGYEDVTRHRKLFHFEFDRVLKSSKRIHVELHRRLIGYAVGDDHLAFGLAGSRGLSEWVWSRAIKAGDTWEMRRGDEFFYLCLHLAKHLIDERRHSVSGHPCSSLLLAMDLHLAIEQWNEDIDWDEFLENVDRFHLSRPVMLALRFVQRWYGAIPEEIEGFLRGVSPRMMKYFCSWAEEEHEFSDGPSIEIPHRLEMVVEAFQMADRWSDRIRILPMVLGESIRRGVQS